MCAWACTYLHPRSIPPPPPLLCMRACLCWYTKSHFSVAARRGNWHEIWLRRSWCYLTFHLLISPVWYLVVLSTSLSVRVYNYRQWYAGNKIETFRLFVLLDSPGSVFLNSKLWLFLKWEYFLVMNTYFVHLFIALFVSRDAEKWTSYLVNTLNNGQGPWKLYKPRLLCPWWHCVD